MAKHRRYCVPCSTLTFCEKLQRHSLLLIKRQPMIFRPLLVTVSLLLLSACDQLGIETPLQMEQKRVAEGKALGGSCRQAGRALEDCYQINPKFPKASIFDGWKEMDAYMRENKLENIAPEFPMKPTESKKKGADADEEADAKPAKKAAAEH